MIKVFPYNELGYQDHGWLKARHHFSFGSYINPNRTEFKTLKVINDDVIAPGKGFPPHSHQDMEIITYVRSGAITHKDDQGNEGITRAGDMQIMSAGSGITHSEYNLEDKDTKLYQIWITPFQQNLAPRWQTHSFPKSFVKDKLHLMVSCDGFAPLFIFQNAFIYGGRMKAGAVINHTLSEDSAYALAAEGKFMLDDKKLSEGDGAEIEDQKEIKIKAITDSEIVLIEVTSWIAIRKPLLSGNL
ncbi:MAG: pirin family protein [Rickettsiales bacterium]